MKTVAEYEYRIPAWGLSALITADTSGLTNEEIALVDKFEQKCNEHVKENSAHSYIIDGWDNEPFFSWHNDFHNLGSNVVDITVVILK